MGLLRGLEWPVPGAYRDLLNGRTWGGSGPAVAGSDTGLSALGRLVVAGSHDRQEVGR